MAQTAVEQIKERLSIIDVIGAYVELHKAGKSYKAKSPFTTEKTPSFYVSPDRGVYFCFSTQKGGDMFTFIQEMEGVDFKGALKILAEKAQVELVAEDPKKRDARETAYALLEEATKFFFDMRETNAHAHGYIIDRGVTEITIRTWRIGYAPDEWRSLKKHLMDKGFTESDIMRAGLIKQPEEGKESYDVFRDRIMFPIMDPSGRVVAFSGRTLKKEEGTPKYVNSPETELYKKSEILYGYDRAKNGIRHYDFSLIVEGQFDLVLSHQAGYTNAVAVSGTAFTPHHLMLLTRLSNRAVLSLDADRAGITAMKRSAVPMLQNGMDVKVAEMPQGEDPADVIRRDPAQFKKLIAASTHVIEFLLRVYKGAAKDERTYKLSVREGITPLLIAIPNRIDREHFEGVVALSIGTTKDAVHFEVERQSELVHESARPLANVSSESKQPAASRRDALIEHLYAYTKVLDDSHETARDSIQAHLTSLLSPEEFKLVEERASSPEVQRVLFAVETHIETQSRKELMSDLSSMLTLLAHGIAREKLAKYKAQMLQAERDDDTEALKEAIEATKNAQNILSTKIEIV